jgi:hypothetical protein
VAGRRRPHRGAGSSTRQRGRRSPVRPTRASFGCCWRWPPPAYGNAVVRQAGQTRTAKRISSGLAGPVGRPRSEPMVPVVRFDPAPLSSTALARRLSVWPELRAPRPYIKSRQALKFGGSPRNDVGHRGGYSTRRLAIALTPANAPDPIRRRHPVCRAKKFRSTQGEIDIRR